MDPTVTLRRQLMREAMLTAALIAALWLLCLPLRAQEVSYPEFPDNSPQRRFRHTLVTTTNEQGTVLYRTENGEWMKATDAIAALEDAGVQERMDMEPALESGKQRIFGEATDE